MSIAITGVSGHLGSLIAKHVLNRSSKAIVHGICRNPDKLPESLRANDRFKVFQTGHDNASKLREALKGSDIAIFATLADQKTMFEGQKAVIDACIDVGVPRYMAGDWSLDFRSLKLGDLPAKDPMIQVAEYLDKKGDGIKGVHVLNGCFMEVIGRSMYKSKDTSVNYWGDGDDQWDITTYNDAANFSAAVALDESASGWFSIRGDRVSAKDFIQAYKTAFEKDPIVVRKGSLDDLYKTMHMVKQQQPDNLWSWLGMYYTYYSTSGDCALPEPLSNHKYDDIQWTRLVEYFKALKQPDKMGMPFDEL